MEKPRRTLTLGSCSRAGFTARAVPVAEVGDGHTAHGDPVWLGNQNREQKTDQRCQAGVSSRAQRDFRQLLQRDLDRRRQRDQKMPGTSRFAPGQLFINHHPPWPEQPECTRGTVLGCESQHVGTAAPWARSHSNFPRGSPRGTKPSQGERQSRRRRAAAGLCLCCGHGKYSARSVPLCAISLRKSKFVQLLITVFAAR